MVRDFAQAQIAPGAADRDRAPEFPRAIFDGLARLGLLGMLVSEDDGGAGADHVSYALAVTEIAAADGALSTAFQVHNSLACMPLVKFGSDRQKESFLKPMAQGEKLGAFCLTEPEAGSDAASIKTRARRVNDGYMLHGAKQFITLGRSADVAIIFAVTDPEAGKNGISAFIVETASPGYQVARVERTLGQHCTDHCHIVLDRCFVPEAQRLGREGEGLRIALSNLEGGRIGVAAQAIGMARAALAVAIDYARERRSFGKPIIEHQAVGFRLAEMATRLQASELMVWRAAQLRDAGQPCLKEASMAKLFATEMAERICHDAIQTLGGYGYLADFPLERIYRDVRVCKIYEGTSDIQRMIIARQLARNPEGVGALV